MLTLSPNQEVIKYFTCNDCGVRFKVVVSSNTKPKYCKYCANSKKEN